MLESAYLWNGSFEMIEWYQDDEVTVFFDRKPNIRMRVLTPILSSKEKRSIEKYPLQLVNSLKVTLVNRYKHEAYEFVIPAKFCYDGASIPKPLWSVIGSNTDVKFAVSALIHDVICQHHEYVKHNRQFSSKVFRGLLLQAGVSKLKANIMYKAVDLYQSFIWKKPKTKIAII